MKTPQTRRKDRRPFNAMIGCLLLLVVGGLKWEWDILSRPRDRNTDTSTDTGTEPDVHAPKVFPTKTSWGYDLSNAGSSSYWLDTPLCGAAVDTMYTMEDLKTHASTDSLFLLIRGYVFDVTKFRAEHPGGDRILEGTEMEAAETFELHHPALISHMLTKFCVGRMQTEAALPQVEVHSIDEKIEEKEDKKEEIIEEKKAEPGKTPWGYTLQGDTEYWSQVELKCKKDGHFEMSDLASKDGESGADKALYLLIRGLVFDVTKFRTGHPGGEEILRGAKKDATELFESIHQPTTAQLLNNFCVGKMYPSDSNSNSNNANTDDTKKEEENAPRTEWGYPLTAGSPDYWGQASFTCNNDKGEKFSMENIIENNGKDGKPFHLLMRGYVLDVTKFVSKHPGGEDIFQGAGKDAADVFEGPHQPTTATLFSNFCIGKLYV